VDLENALLEFDTIDEIQDIIDRVVTVAELAKLVKGLSANSKQATVSIKHSFSKTLSLTTKWNHSIRDYPKIVLPPGVDDIINVPPEDYDKIRKVAPNIASDEYSVRLVTSESFHPRDSTIILYAFTRSDGYTGDPQVEAYTANRITFNYRRPFGLKLRTNTSLLIRDRKETNTGNKVFKITPKETVTYAVTKKFKWYMEFSFEYGDTTTIVANAPSKQHEDIYSFYGGYIWDF